MVAEEFKYEGTDNHLLENLPNVGYAEEEPNEGDIFYMMEEPNKLFINFLDVKLVCYKCKSIFSFKSLLHKYLKSNCVEQNQRNTAALPPAPVLQNVIKFKASTKAVGSGYVFRG